MRSKEAWQLARHGLSLTVTAICIQEQLSNRDYPATEVAVVRARLSMPIEQHSAGAQRRGVEASGRLEPWSLEGGSGARGATARTSYDEDNGAAPTAVLRPHLDPACACFRSLSLGTLAALAGCRRSRQRIVAVGPAGQSSADPAAFAFGTRLACADPQAGSERKQQRPPLLSSSFCPAESAAAVQAPQLRPCLDQAPISGTCRMF